MKKTLVALTVAAFATSASAVTLYDNEGTKVDFAGSVRVILAKDGTKVTTGNVVSKKNAHSNLKNAGSRFNITVKHNLSENFYALGHYETRFANGASNAAGWGNIETNKGYLGFGGHGHQVTFGKQNVIGDNIGQAGFDNYFDVGSQNIYGRTTVETTKSVIVNDAGQVVPVIESKPKNSAKAWSVLTTSSDSAVNYTYTGIKGLTLGANYNFANSRKNNEVNNDSAKSGFGLGAIYTFDVAENQALTFSAGYTHDDFATGNRTEKDKDGVYFGAKYKVNNFTVAVDGGRGVEKVKAPVAADSSKNKLKYVRAGARFDVTPAVGVYTNYSYGTLREGTEYKNTAHQYMLGTDYAFSKHVNTYAEARVIKQKDNQQQQRKINEKAVGVGVRVFW